MIKSHLIWQYKIWNILPFSIYVEDDYKIEFLNPDPGVYIDRMRSQDFKENRIRL